MKRVYVAGKLNDDACGYIKNIHRMIIWAEKVRKLGFAVFVPGLDFLQGVVFGNWDYQDYFDNSQPWLDVADAVFLVPGWEQSKGTGLEIARAKRKNIPIYSELDLLAKELGDLR
uniref:DUF4406 domain-containing protein n=1 Tax=viral metagenome TaxID=1070528 RepID=A0A6M3JPK4_9ZZZZ